MGVVLASCFLMLTRTLVGSHYGPSSNTPEQMEAILSQKAKKVHREIVKIHERINGDRQSQKHGASGSLVSLLKERRGEHHEHGHYIVDGVIDEPLNQHLHKGHHGVGLNKNASNTSKENGGCLEWVQRAPKPPYFLTVVLLVRIYKEDKAKLTTKEMKEWLQYLRYAGVEHVYIYDAWVYEQESQLSMLKAFEEDGYITYVDWHTHNPYTISGTQVAAYQNCIEKYSHETAWQAAIDIDEYPFSTRDTAPGFLYRYVKDFSDYHPQVSEITMQNYLYLGNPLEKELMIERLFRRTHQPANPLVKPIYKPSHVRAQVHHNGLKRGRSMNAPSAELRMNHYWGARLQNWGKDTPEILERTELDYGIQPIITAFKECEVYIRPYLEYINI